VEDRSSGRRDDLLEGLRIFGLGFPRGANGSAYREGSVYVANTERRNLARIPVEIDGSAGVTQPLVETPALIGADGIELDVHGRIFVGVDLANVIVRFAPDGSGPTIVATPADGLNFTSSLAFGTGRATARACS
jgi:sugar lactone lactonase YvrE